MSFNAGFFVWGGSTQLCYIHSYNSPIFVLFFSVKELAKKKVILYVKCLLWSHMLERYLSYLSFYVSPVEQKKNWVRVVNIFLSFS